MQASSCVIDALSLPRRQPASVEELCEIVRTVPTGEAVYPVGGGTQLGLGLPPGKKGSAIDLRRLAAVIDYPARDMTITVQAGLTIAELQKLLAAEKQRLPVDIPRSEQATLGGVLAANTSGLRRYGCGTLRDYVIGISAVNDQGTVIKGGGRVVKNVAGYDLCKMFIGSLGTLGIISQVTLKVLPQPDFSALLALTASDTELETLLQTLHQSHTRPIAVELLNPAAVAQLNQRHGLNLPEQGWLGIVGFESNESAVNWQVQQLILELKTTYALEGYVGPSAQPLWAALTDLPGWTEPALTLKAAMLPSQCAAICRQLNQGADHLLLQAHAGNGIVIAHFTGSLTGTEAAAILERWRHTVAAAQGSVIVLRCPTEWKEQLSVWGPPRPDVVLMRALKEQLDPRRIFNPGRFVDGL